MIVYEDDLAKGISPESVCRMMWDRTKPNGTPRKLCDISRLSALGFTAKTRVFEGIKKVYSDFLSKNIGQ
jgi:GDP-L-fucose synthase